MVGRTVPACPSGSEEKAPVDLHHLVALSAPRACLLSIAYNDDVENTWAMQQTYLACKPVWELYGAADRIRILWRAGGHETRAETIERYLDWCDWQFGRGDPNCPKSSSIPGIGMPGAQTARRPFFRNRFPSRRIPIRNRRAPPPAACWEKGRRLL